MKTIILEGNRLPLTAPRLSWYFLSDSAPANAGKPFFIPDFADRFEALIAPVLRISRLGKSIGARFASRYYSEIAPAIHFRAPGLRSELQAAGMASDMAQSFDRSLIIGQFMPMERFLENPRIKLLKNGEPAAEWKLSDFSTSVSEAIAEISVSNTMKTGDLVVPGLSAPVGIEPGDRLSLMLEGERELLVAVR